MKIYRILYFKTSIVSDEVGNWDKIKLSSSPPKGGGGGKGASLHQKGQKKKGF